MTPPVRLTCAGIACCLRRLSSQPSYPDIPSRRESGWLQDVLRRALPADLWGAAGLVFARGRRCSTSKTFKVVQAASLDVSPEGEGAETPSKATKEELQTLREKLEFKPKLTLPAKMASVLLPAGICYILYFVTNPASISLPYAAGMSMIYVAWVAICRALFLERLYAARLQPERELGDKDSKFAKIEGVIVHYKACQPAIGASKAAIHCFHGFGANTGSWSQVHSKMANTLQAQVTTHDMPAFGLTERPTDAKKYTLDFNGRLGREVMDLELMRNLPSSSPRDSVSSFEAVKTSFSAAKDAPDAFSQGDNAAIKKRALPSADILRALMGHSLGGACAAAEVIENPEAVDALILVAPAIMAFGFLIPAGFGKSGRMQTSGPYCTVNFSKLSSTPVVKNLRRPTQKHASLRLIIALAQSILAIFSGFATFLMQPFTIVTLRSAVRSRAFWERGLARAWFDRAGVTPEVVDAYRQPQLVRGWEKGLVRFAAARLSGGRSLKKVLSDAWKGNFQPTQAELLAETIVKHNIKVLIIHGSDDRLVPVSNSRRLAALLPGAQLVVMPQTGHVPHEERPSEFLDKVQAFMGSL